MKIRVLGTMEEIGDIVEENEVWVWEVMCSAAKHRVSLDHDGNVTAHDHQDDDNEAFFSDMDEPRTPCMRVRKQLRDWFKAGSIVW